MSLELIDLLRPVDAETARLAARVRESVVQVKTRSGHGAGVIWDRRGWIVTNHHVVGQERAWLETTDGREFEAVVTARDPANDLALLEVISQPLGLFPAVAVSDTQTLRVGELVLAVGNPWGIPGTATLGIISATGGSLGWGRSNRRREVIHADVVLAPGNSGGPLVNMAGEVVGIASMVLSPGIALAIPSHTVQRFIERAHPALAGQRQQTRQAA